MDCNVIEEWNSKIVSKLKESLDKNQFPMISEMILTTRRSDFAWIAWEEWNFKVSRTIGSHICSCLSLG